MFKEKRGAQRKKALLMFGFLFVCQPPQKFKEGGKPGKFFRPD